MKTRARKFILYPSQRKYMLDAARGLTAQQSAKLHGVSAHTVQSSLKAARTRLGAQNIAHAVALCIIQDEFTYSEVTSIEKGRNP